MKIFPITSSSSGNCTIIEKGDDVVLIDCGTTLKGLKQAVGDLERIKAVFITHEHGDHISGVGPVSRKIDCPFYVNELSLKKKPNVFQDCKNLENLVAGTSVEVVPTLDFLPFTTKHDSAYSVGFVVTDKITGKKYGHLTDTGFITPMIKFLLKDCKALFIEADYDAEFLEEYEHYDDFLKERISSNFGHLSNDQAFEFLQNDMDMDKLDFIIVGHLSAKTNSPARIVEYIEKYFPSDDQKQKFKIAPLSQAIHWEDK